jgi:hypothetical protein
MERPDRQEFQLNVTDELIQDMLGVDWSDNAAVAERLQQTGRSSNQPGH